MPTLMGRDSDDAWAVGEVGRAGVAVDTLADMEDLFAGIDLGDGHDVDDHQRARRRSLMAMYVAVAEETRRSSGPRWAARSRTTS